MRHLKLYQVCTLLLVLALVLTIDVSGQAVSRASQNREDSSQIASVEEMAKRVDSLQFIVVYNAELLRRDLDSKMILIFVMLGIIIVACLLMYVLLRQNQIQRKGLEEKLTLQLSSSVADLETKIRHIEAELSPPKPPARKKKTK